MEATETPAGEGSVTGPAKGPVLIIDDDARILRALSIALEGQGYVVITAGSGREALRYLKHNPPPRVILTDLVMPDINGPQLRMELEADPALATIPVIVMSGTRDTRAEAFFLNAAGHLDKPINLADLIATVARFCRDPA